MYLLFPQVCEAGLHIPKVCEAGLHISLGIGLRLFNMLQQECQELDLLIALETDKVERTSAEQEIVGLLRTAQALEREAEEIAEVAEQHQTVHDWYCAAAEPAEENLIPLDVQLAQLRGLVKEHLRSATSKVWPSFKRNVFLYLCMLLLPNIQQRRQ